MGHQRLQHNHDICTNSNNNVGQDVYFAMIGGWRGTCRPLIIQCRYQFPVSVVMKVLCSVGPGGIRILGYTAIYRLDWNNRIVLARCMDRGEYVSLVYSNESRTYLSGDDNQICLLGGCLLMTYVVLSPTFNVKTPCWARFCHEDKKSTWSVAVEDIHIPSILHRSPRCQVRLLNSPGILLGDLGLRLLLCDMFARRNCW